MTAVVQHLVTTDPDTAERALRTLYDTATLREPRDPGSFRFVQRVVGDERVNVAELEFDAEVTSTSDLESGLSIVTTTSGRLDLWAAGRPRDTGRPLLAVPGAYRTEFAHAHVVVANFGQTALQDMLRAHRGTDRIAFRFPAVSPLGPEKERLWRETLAFTRRTVLVPDAVEADLVQAAAMRMLMAVALDVFGVEVEGPAGPLDGAGPATIRRAQAFIDEHATEPITVEDVAAAARLSVRGLEAAFRRTLGTTPIAYLRRVRLELARSMLMAADPSTTSVRAIALQTGFAHGGRFSAAYLEAFGEHPRRTLHA